MKPVYYTVALLAASLFTRTGHAQTNAAVSAINGKMDYAGGNLNGLEVHTLEASLTLPVTRQFGFQADTLYSHIDIGNDWGGAAHAFWRDPDYGLLGLTGGYLHNDHIDMGEIGIEGAYYFHQFTLGLFAGVGTLKSEYPTLIKMSSPGGITTESPFREGAPTDFIGRLSVDYYPLENLRVGAAYAWEFQMNLYKGEVEYQTPIPGLALTGEAAVGSDNYNHWLFGLRYYFGASKTLINRHRQDDPPGFMHQLLEGLSQYQTKNRLIGPPSVHAHTDPGGRTYYY